MGLKKFMDLYAVDVSKHTRKKGQFDYVEWAKVLVLLYENGAERVQFYSEPVIKLANKDLPYIRCHVIIDAESYYSDYPIIENNQSPKMEAVSQMQVHKAEARGFVKCIAINTGLGLQLWMKEESILDEVKERTSFTTPEETSEKMDEFLEWNNQINDCKSLADLGVLYMANKEVVESEPNIKVLFTRAKKKYS
jgi:hypothetical protein